jgi:hypothetical protein
MSESRVERLMRLAEEAALAGDTDRAHALLAVLSPAIYLREQETKALKRLMKVRDV